MNFGERAKLIRKHFSLKQREMADSLGLKQGSYSKIELGAVGMSMSVLQTLLEKYNIDINWLLTGEGEMFRTSSFSNKELKEKNFKLIEENSNLKTRIITLLDNQYSKEPVLSH